MELLLDASTDDAELAPNPEAKVRPTPTHVHKLYRRRHIKRIHQTNYNNNNNKLC